MNDLWDKRRAKLLQANVLVLRTRDNGKDLTTKDGGGRVLPHGGTIPRRLWRFLTRDVPEPTMKRARERWGMTSNAVQFTLNIADNTLTYFDPDSETQQEDTLPIGD